MQINELKEKFTKIMLTRDVNLLGKTVELWCNANNIQKLEFSELEKEDLYGYCSDYNIESKEKLDRLTFRLKWFDHILEIVFRGSNGQYLIVCMDEERAYEVGPNCIWNDNPELLTNIYAIYTELFEAIFNSFNLYLDKDEVETKDVTISLTEKERNFLSTIFKEQSKNGRPRLYVVNDIGLLPAKKGYGNNYLYQIRIENNEFSYESIKLVSKKLTSYLEKVILKDVKDKKVEKIVKELFEQIKNISYSSCDLDEETEELLNDECSNLIDNLDSYSEIMECINFNPLKEMISSINCYIEDIVEDDSCSISVTEVYEINKPVAFFLSREEAEKYLKYQEHNLKKPNIFSYDFGFGNIGDLPSLFNTLTKLNTKIKED